MSEIKDPKKQAHILQVYLKALGHDVKLGWCYEAISLIRGYANWNTYSALYNKNNGED